ncbi:plac8 onzin related protein 6 isoform 1-T3 [Clarias gariepinus]|uniref:plac8 onzin related protein 6 isoform X1 n=2 Tax=Clarias gariepinus TaxID=13013 RepID=UPI00234C5426|nr:plac8 onzin related protein 6 isoform X1 [Clarias gariepinus]XP_053359976.1 plac8 onzin related protein 6 isoform X1 [Clarias gariepinus]XP_053359984.1 plac8 onzin related protein 6 isoform X1 [Clarias gariepinus]
MAATTTTITMQPGVMLSPNAKVNTWSSGLCDCCEDMSICCFGFWCPWCLMCTTSQEFGECLCLPLLDMCFGAIIPAASYSVRSAVRERYHIKGTMCDDCCVVTCCGICSWCQIARELKFRRQPQVFVNPPVNVTYQTAANTSYQPVAGMNQSYPPGYAQPPMSPNPQSGGLYPAV